MAEAEQLLINYVEFQKQICSSFTALREDFCDVTLSGKGEQSIEAHKIILSASSPVFRKILKNSRHNHPYIYMMNVEENTLAQLVKFIYHGEITLNKKDLDDFMALAEDLQVTTLSNIEPQNKLKKVSEVAKTYEPNTKHKEIIDSSKSITSQNIGMELGEIVKETNTYSEPSGSAIKKDLTQKKFQLKENNPRVEELNMHNNYKLSSSVPALLCSPATGSPIHLEPKTEVHNESISLPDLYLSLQETQHVMTDENPTADQMKQAESLFQICKDLTKTPQSNTSESLTEDEASLILQKPNSLIERYASAWRCTVCQKICSSKKLAKLHLETRHHVTKTYIMNGLFVT